ncbi:MAG: hypothetical protein WC222_01760 [Parachlamydiales bacterium]|jgi:hypothetical protein
MSYNSVNNNYSSWICYFQLRRFESNASSALNAGNTYLAKIWEDKLADYKTKISGYTATQLLKIQVTRIIKAFGILNLIRTIAVKCIHPASFFHRNSVDSLYGNIKPESDMPIHANWQERLFASKFLKSFKKHRDIDPDPLIAFFDGHLHFQSSLGVYFQLQHLLNNRIKFLKSIAQIPKGSLQDTHKALVDQSDYSDYLDELNYGLKYLSELIFNARQSGIATIEDFRQEFKNTHPMESTRNKNPYDSYSFRNNFIRKLTETGRAQRINFHTPLLDPLDGIVIYPQGLPPENNRKTILFCSGNASCYENEFILAERLADRFQVNVVLYNGPEIMLSQGTEINFSDAVEAFKCVITHIKKNWVENDPDKIGVIGFSFGGAVSAIGLAELAKDNELNTTSTKGIGRYINIHSFSALSNIDIKPLRGFSWISSLIKKIIALIRMDDLNAAEALSKERVAKSTWVTHTPWDHIIRKDFRLDKTLKQTLSTDEQKSLNISFFESHPKVDKFWRNTFGADPELSYYEKRIRCDLQRHVNTSFLFKINPLTQDLLHWVNDIPTE